MEKIITEYVRPPIPVRLWDWAATFEDYDEGGIIGTGPTEHDAIADLLAIEKGDPGRIGQNANKPPSKSTKNGSKNINPNRNECKNQKTTRTDSRQNLRPT